MLLGLAGFLVQRAKLRNAVSAGLDSGIGRAPLRLDLGADAGLGGGERSIREPRPNSGGFRGRTRRRGAGRRGSRSHSPTRRRARTAPGRRGPGEVHVQACSLRNRIDRCEKAGGRRAHSSCPSRSGRAAPDRREIPPGPPRPARLQPRGIHHAARADAAGLRTRDLQLDFARRRRAPIRTGLLEQPMAAAMGPPRRLASPASASM